MARKIKIENPELEFVEIPYDESDFEVETDPVEIAKAIEEARADRIKWEQEGKPKLEALMQTYIWKIVDDIIDELIEKEDIIETTARQCTVSYIISTLKNNNLLNKEAFKPWLKK